MTENVLVILDLGNVHDCLKKLDTLNLKNVNVIAFHDYMYNGYGVNKIVTNQSIKIIGAVDQNRNSADIMMIWFLAQYKNPTDHIIVVTKDQGFQTLYTLLKRDKKANKISVAHDWKSLSELLNF